MVVRKLLILVVLEQIYFMSGKNMGLKNASIKLI